MNVSNKKLLPVIGVALIVVIVAYCLLNAPDRRDASQKIGDAVNELGQGPKKAMRQLEDRTPGEKLQDAAQDPQPKAPAPRPSRKK